MHSSKFIQIRKERSIEQRLASIWLDACSELEIPCILIYQDHWNAYISVNLKFIPETLAEKINPEMLQEQLAYLQQKYTFGTNGYCQHNLSYHTFDVVPKESSQSLAIEIFDTIMHATNKSASFAPMEQQMSA